MVNLLTKFFSGTTFPIGLNFSIYDALKFEGDLVVQIMLVVHFVSHVGGKMVAFA